MALGEKTQMNDKEQEALLKLAVEYFKKKDGYKKFFDALEKKFYTYGKLSGSISLAQFNENEISSLKTFLGHNIGQSIKIKDIRASLKASKFEGISLESLTEEFNGRTLIYKKDKMEKLAENKADFLKNAKENHKAKTKLWLDRIFNNNLLGINKIYENDKALCLEMLNMLMTAFDELPFEEGNEELIAVFAESYTGNPHYFDQNKSGYAFLMDFLSFYFNEIDKKSISAITENDSLLDMAGLIKNEIQISTLEWGLEGLDNNNDEHIGLKSFKQIGEPLELSLLNLKNIKELKKNVNSIYVFENPSVFVKIMEFLKERGITTIALICTRGQLNSADYKLLELIKKSKINMLYAGDFDPEGLLIAQRVIQGYGAKALCYEKKYYNIAASNESLSEKRLNGIKNIKATELEEIKEQLELNKKAGYQEALIEEYMRFIAKDN